MNCDSADLYILPSLLTLSNGNTSDEDQLESLDYHTNKLLDASVETVLDHCNKDSFIKLKNQLPKHETSFKKYFKTQLH